MDISVLETIAVNNVPALVVALIVVFAQYFVTKKTYDKEQGRMIDDINKVGEKINNQESRLVILESNCSRFETILSNIPRREDLHEIETKLSKSIADMNGELNRVIASLDGLKHIISQQGTQIANMNTHLLKTAGDK